MAASTRPVVIIFSLFMPTIFLQKDARDANSDYGAPRQMHRSLKIGNEASEQEARRPEPKAPGIRRRNQRSPLDGLFGSFDNSEGREIYNKVAASAKKYNRLYLAKLKAYNALVESFNSVLRGKNMMAFRLSHFQKAVRMKVRKFRMMFMLDGEQEPLRPPKREFNPVVENSFLEIAKPLGAPAPALEHHSERVDSYRHAQAVRFEDMAYRAYMKLRSELEEALQNRVRLKSEAARLRLLLPIWSRRYDDIFAFEQEMKSPEMAGKVRLCKSVRCEMPAILQ